MRLLDRYLLRELALPVVYCLDAFLMLWIVVDLFGRMDDFLEHGATLGQAIRYYLVSLPEAVVQMVPLALLLGLLFCLSNFAKHNELLAMRAGGLSRVRLAIPLLGVGLAAALVVLGINEWLVPGARAHARSLLNTLKGRGTGESIRSLFSFNVREQRDWYARSFDLTTGEMHNLEIHQRTDRGEPLRDVYAESGRYVDGRWVLQEVEVRERAPDGDVNVERHAQTALPWLTERPRELALENKEPPDMTSAELRRIIRGYQRSHQTARVPELRSELHARYAVPLTCVVVLWLGIPLGMNMRRGGALWSVGVALALAVGFHFTSEIAFALGRGGQISPILSAWVTNLTFVVIGAGLMWRLR